MRQKKIAISLAIIGAVAAPFVFHTWKLRPTSETFVSLTADKKEEIAAYLKKTDNCATTANALAVAHARGSSYMDAFNANYFCETGRDSLERGAETTVYFSAPKYFAINLAVVIGAFVSIFVLAFLIPAVSRRYWKWLNT